MGPAKLLLPFYVPPGKGSLESLLETAQEMLPSCGLGMAFPCLIHPLKPLRAAPSPLKLEAQKAKIAGQDKNNLQETAT